MSNIRFGVTCIDIDGNRKLAVPAQARHLYDRREDAEEWLRAVLARPDNLDRLRQIHGPQALGTYRVDPFDCWEHGDPKGIFVHEPSLDAATRTLFEDPEPEPLHPSDAKRPRHPRR